MRNYTPEQVHAVKEAFAAYADHLTLAGHEADAADHWAWEYRYADDVREYLTDWLTENFPNEEDNE